LEEGKRRRWRIGNLRFDWARRPGFFVGKGETSGNRGQRGEMREKIGWDQRGWKGEYLTKRGIGMYGNWCGYGNEYYCNCAGEYISSPWDRLLYVYKEIIDSIVGRRNIIRHSRLVNKPPSFHIMLFQLFSSIVCHTYSRLSGLACALPVACTRPRTWPKSQKRGDIRYAGDLGASHHVPGSRERDPISSSQ
jgi:hypothetical protein